MLDQLDLLQFFEGLPRMGVPQVTMGFKTKKWLKWSTEFWMIRFAAGSALAAWPPIHGQDAHHTLFHLCQGRLRYSLGQVGLLDTGAQPVTVGSGYHYAHCQWLASLKVNWLILPVTVVCLSLSRSSSPSVKTARGGGGKESKRQVLKRAHSKWRAGRKLYKIKTWKLNSCTAMHKAAKCPYRGQTQSWPWGLASDNPQSGAGHQGHRRESWAQNHVRLCTINMDGFSIPKKNPHNWLLLKSRVLVYQTIMFLAFTS
jgi:hypothetical protein